MTSTINDQFDNPIAVGDTVKITALDSSGGANLAMSQATWTVVSIGRTRAKLTSSAWGHEPTVVGRCLRIIEAGDGRSLAHTADSHWAKVQAALKAGIEPHMTTRHATETQLTEAYHVVYDVKDSLDPYSRAFYVAYEACGRIIELMQQLEMTVPERFDGDGRTVANGGLR